MAWFVLVLAFMIRTASSDRSDDILARLVGGKNAYEGRVQVRYKGIWKGVCDHKWSMREARVACRMLGYPDVERFTRGYVIVQSTKTLTSPGYVTFRNLRIKKLAISVCLLGKIQHRWVSGFNWLSALKGSNEASELQRDWALKQIFYMRNIHSYQKWMLIGQDFKLHFRELLESVLSCLPVILDFPFVCHWQVVQYSHASNTGHVWSFFFIQREQRYFSYHFGGKLKGPETPAKRGRLCGKAMFAWSQTSLPQLIILGHRHNHQITGLRYEMVSRASKNQRRTEFTVTPFSVCYCY